MTTFFSTFNIFGNHNNNSVALSPLGESLKKLSLDYPAESRKSPFSIYPQDSHQLVIPPKRTSIDEVDFLLSINFIGEIEKAILKIVNKMYFVTSIQIFQMLNIEGFNVEHKKIQYIIKKLKNKSFLKQIEFYSVEDNESKSSFRAYTLGYHGVGIIRASGEISKLQGYIAQQPTENIKKTLATNQLLIGVMQKTEITFESLLCLVGKEGLSDILIRPRAVFESNGHTYLVECVRKEQNWKEDLLERLKQYQKIVRKHKNLNVPLNEKPTLLILAESYEHIIEINNLIPNTLDFSIIYSYDLALYDDVHNAFFIS